MDDFVLRRDKPAKEVELLDDNSIDSSDDISIDSSDERPIQATPPAAKVDASKGLSASVAAAASKMSLIHYKHRKDRNKVYDYFKKFLVIPANMQELNAYCVCTLCKKFPDKIVYRGSSSTKMLDHIRVHHLPLYNQLNEEVIIKKYRVNEPLVSKPVTATQPSVSPALTPKKRGCQTTLDYGWEGNAEKTRFERMMQYIVLNHKPISTAENEEFRAFIHSLNPDTSLNLCSTERCRAWIRERALVGRIKLGEILKDKYVAITTDHWSSTVGDSYAGYTCHTIDQSFCYRSYVLGCIPNRTNTTADQMRKDLGEVMKKFNIDMTKIVCVISDTAANMNLLGKNLLSEGIQWSGCSAHLLQLVVNTVLGQDPHIDLLLKKCRQIVGHYNHGGSHSLFSAQAAQEKSPTKLMQDCTTRWWSTYLMIDSLLDNIVALKFVMLSNGFDYNLTEQEWDDLNFLRACLKSFKDAQKILEGQSYITASFIVYCIGFIAEDLKSHISQNKNPVLVKFAKTLLKDLCKRFGNFDERVFFENVRLGDRGRIIGIPSLTMHAYFLDPRTKKMKYLNESDRHAIIASIHSIAADTAVPSAETASNTSVPADIDDDQEENGIVAAMRRDIRAEQLAAAPTSVLADEINLYIAEKSLDLFHDPLQWWKLKAPLYPNLSKYAKRVLTVLSTSAPCERLFSSAALVVTTKRNRLHPDNVDDELFIAENYKNLELQNLEINKVSS